MSSAVATRIRNAPTEQRSVQTTLLDLVHAVSETTANDREVVATVLHLLRSGHVQLCGTLKDEPIDQF